MRLNTTFQTILVGRMAAGNAMSLGDEEDMSLGAAQEMRPAV
jgi:hypothetical protein